MRHPVVQPPSPLNEQEITAIAAEMLAMPTGDEFIAARIALMTIVEDAAGLALWLAVEEKVRTIRDAEAA